MPEVKLNISCGCGFRTTTLEEAIKHSQEKNHTLTVLGEIKAERR